MAYQPRIRGPALGWNFPSWGIATKPGETQFVTKLYPPEIGPSPFAFEFGQCQVGVFFQRFFGVKQC